MDARTDVAAKIQRNSDVTDAELHTYLEHTENIEQLAEHYKKQFVSYTERETITSPLAIYYRMQLAATAALREEAMKAFLDCFQVELAVTVNLSGIKLENADLRGLNFSKVKLSGISFIKNQFDGAVFFPADAFESEQQFSACLDELQKNHAAAIFENDEELNAYQHLLLDNIMKAFSGIHSFHKKHILLALAYEHSLFKSINVTINKNVSAVSIMQQTSPLLRHAKEGDSYKQPAVCMNARN